MSADNGKPARRRLGGALTRKQREIFLERLAAGDTVEKAAQTAERPRQTFNSLRQRDEAFAVAWHDAIEAGVEMLEQQLVDVALARREVRNMAAITACFGVLRKRRPELWRESYHGPGSARGVGGQTRLDLSKLSDEEAALLTRLVGKARGQE